MQPRIRAVMLGLLAVMLAGSVMAATASAGPGPFWYHKAPGEKGNGVKVSSPESFSGEGGKQTFTGTIGKEAIEITSKSVQVKGAITNNAFQGQVKLELIYTQPTMIKPISSGCEVVVGEKNIVQVKGHLMWKYNGVPKQLEEQKQEAQSPYIVFTPKEIQQGATGIPGGTFTTITFKGSPCGVLAGSHEVAGSQIGFPSPSTVGTFSKTLAVRTTGGQKELVHFWNGEKNIEGKVGLLFGSNEDCSRRSNRSHCQSTRNRDI